MADTKATSTKPAKPLTDDKGDYLDCPAGAGKTVEQVTSSPLEDAAASIEADKQRDEAVKNR